LTTKDIADILQDWEVRAGDINSDHRLIQFKIGKGDSYRNIKCKKRFITDNADWDLFNLELAKQVNIHNTALYEEALEDRTELLMQAITKSAERSIPMRSIRYIQKPPWWTKEIEDQRRIMRRSYRAIQEATQNEKIERRKDYNQERNTFVKLLRTEKKKSWRRFAGEIRDDKWGRCFRWIKKGSQNHEAPSVIKKNDGQHTKTLRETLKYLLDTLIPSDYTQYGDITEPRKERLQHKPASLEEVKNAIWRMSTRKSPGGDGIDATILRKEWPIIKDIVTRLFNDLIAYGYFPRLWRMAEVVTILKSKEKPREDPKSFRPVSLLPVLGKALEHLVCERLRDEISDNLAPNQHGFTKNKSMLTAIKEVKNWTDSRREKHVLGVFLDISGAFDNVRWAPLIEDMTNLGATLATINMTKSYLVDRVAKITSNQTEVETKLTKGCPQGSGFGPSLWNIAVNQILNTDKEDTHRVAYADDIAVLISGNTRKELYSKTEEYLKDLMDWSSRYGLQFSPTKSMAMALKGGLQPGHHIKFGDARIKTVERTKYLGITIDGDFKFKSQIQNIVKKQTAEFSRVRSMTGRDWGADYNSALLLYKVIYIPRVTYAASIWMTDWGKTDRQHLSKGQRIPLLAVSGAYRTAPTEGLQIIAGLLPLDLQILWEGTKQETKSGALTQQDQEDLRDNILDIWQNRWDGSTKARWTHKIIPDVRIRLSIPLEIDHYITQYLTGHGNFAHKLHLLGLKDSPDCNCGQGQDDAEHAIYSCGRWSEQRGKLKKAVEDEGEQWPCDPNTLIKTRKIYSAFRKFAKDTLVHKHQEEFPRAD